MAKRSNEIDGDNVGPELFKRGRGRRERFREKLKASASRARRRNDLTPDLPLEWLAPSDLKPASRRVRLADEAQVVRVGQTIEAIGFCVPILTTKKREILDGHIRWEAAKRLGLDRVPCIVVDHLSRDERRVLRLAVNRHAERGEWDFEALKLEFEELIVLGAPLEVSGFEAPEIDLIVLGEGLDDGDLGPLDPDEDAEPIARCGDVWALGEHRLACADARDPRVYAALMQGELARLVLTDPPYNVPIAGHVTSRRHREFAMASGEMDADEFAAFNAAWMAATLRHLMDGGLIMPFIDWRSVDLMIGVGKGFGLDHINLIVWSKDNPGQGSLWRSQHELIPVFKLGTEPHINNVELGRHGRRRSNVWEYPGATSIGSDARKGLKAHPTVKPVALIEDALLDVTNRGDLVLEPFLGSGSTLIAAQTTGRICRSIEIDPLYVDVAIRRWMALTGKRPERIHARDEEVADPLKRLPPPPLALPAPDGEA